MFRKVFPLAAAFALAASFALAQDAAKTAPVKITGYVIDRMCSEMHGTEEEAQKHPNACALMPACEKSGFVVVSGGKTYRLDEQGAKLAAEALKAARTKKGLKVDVEGTLEGDTLHAAKLEEAK